MKELEQLYDDVLRIYRENGKTDYDAGVVQGVKQAIEVFNYAKPLTAAEIGKKGRQVNTEAQQKTARENGRNGGKPSNAIRKQAVEVFSKIGHELTESDFSLSRSTVENFLENIIGYELSEHETVNGIYTITYRNATHKNGKKFQWFVIIDLGEWRAVFKLKDKRGVKP